LITRLPEDLAEERVLRFLVAAAAIVELGANSE